MSTSGFGFGRGPFDDFDDLFGRFFGSGPLSAQRRPRQVDVGSLLSERARELVARAQQAAAREGSEELGARHLPAAALEVDSTRRMLTEAGVDVDALGRRLGAGAALEAAPGSGPNELSPSAKRALLDEVGEHGDGLVLFLDELHTVVGAGGGGEGAMDAGNMFKPALARGELHLIGATTVDEYRKHIEKDAALERRFAPILVGEPTVDDTVEILRGLRDRYEAHHQVRIQDEALVAAAELSDRYVTSRFLPDKAIDLMDQAAARVRLRARTTPADTRDIEDRIAALGREKDQAVAEEDYERAKDLRDRIRQTEQELKTAQAEDHDQAEPKVTAEDVAEVVSRTTGIPVAQLTEEERERLMRLEGHLHQRVVGQDEAVAAVARAVRRARAGMADPDRPVGSFLFLGPTGVGKTELARALAVALFGDENRMIRFDMSEFQERHTVARLVGAPPGYVGYDEAGQLTEAVRRQPYAVLLLDEVEKAHPDVFNVLLQLLDDGRLTDAQGRTVDFKNTVVIMTSDIGADRILSAGVEDYAKVRASVMPSLQQHFRPEFLNRIDEIIVFRGLERGQLRQIVDLLLEHTRRRLHAQDVALQVTDAAADLLARPPRPPARVRRPAAAPHHPARARHPCRGRRHRRQRGRRQRDRPVTEPGQPPGFPRTGRRRAVRSPLIMERTDAR
ncbi:AAA family ATPase [Streptomyces hirsutus]